MHMVTKTYVEFERLIILYIVNRNGIISIEYVTRFVQKIVEERSVCYGYYYYYVKIYTGWFISCMIITYIHLNIQYLHCYQRSPVGK